MPAKPSVGLFCSHSSPTRHKPQLYYTWHWSRFSKGTAHGDTVLLYLLPQHCRDKERRKSLCLCSPLPPTAASLFNNAMFKLINFHYGWDSLRVKNTTSCSDLVCIWQKTGKPTALTHLHRKVKKVKSSTEQHNSLVVQSFHGHHGHISST